jgi:hypothetical protein
MGKETGPGNHIRRVCFERFADWENAIRENLASQYELTFSDLWDVEPAAFDAVFPLQQMNYSHLDKYSFLRGKRFFVPDHEAVELCDDKLTLTKFLIAKGFGGWVPRLRPAGPPYPYIWKARVGSFGQQCHIVRSTADEAALNLRDPDWFAQAVTPGNVEYATHILRANGEIRYVSTFGYKMAGALVVKGRTNKPIETQFRRDCYCLSLFSEILARIGYEGTACFNYKIQYGQPLIFEVNPRFGASLAGDITAYCDAYIAALSSV